MTTVLVFLRCLCVCVCVRVGVGVWGVVGVCACVGLACLSAFVSALGSDKMGRHKLPITIIIIIIKVILFDKYKKGKSL